MGTASEINAIQASSMDPSDMEAYNLTMYGMNQVRDSQVHIVSTVGDVNNYRIPEEAAALMADPTPVATSATYAVEHTSISSSLTSFTVPDNLFSPFLADPSCILPTHTPSLWLVYGIFGILLGKFLILRR
jgi:hypothetical protein